MISAIFSIYLVNLFNLIKIAVQIFFRIFAKKNHGTPKKHRKHGHQNQEIS